MSLSIVTYALAKQYANLVALGITSISFNGTEATFTINETGETVTVDLLGKYTLSNELTASTAIGSVEIGKVYPSGTELETIIRDMLTTYRKAQMNITLNPSAELYSAVDDLLSSISITAQVNKGSRDIQSINFYIDGIEVNEIIDNVTNGGNFSYNHIFTPSKKNTFTVKVSAFDGVDTVEASKTISFLPYCYYGYIDDTISIVDENVIKQLSKELKNSKKFIYNNITMDFGRVIYAIPKELGKITSIRDDVNNFDYTNSFEEINISVDGFEYYMYILKDYTAADNVQLTFL